MADELRMQAVVGDGFSAPLRSLNNLLNQTARNSAGAAVSKDWQGVSGTFNKLTTDIRSGLTPALSGIGITSLGVAGAITGIGAAVKNFAGQTQSLSIFSREIGLGVKQLREMKAIGENFGMSWDQAQGTLKTFAGNLDLVRRNWGSVGAELKGMRLGDLVEDLQKAPNMQAAIDAALEGIKGIANPVYRRKVAELLFGSDQWATIASELTPRVRKEIQSMLSDLPKGSEEAAAGFNLGLTKMQLGIDDLRNHAIGPLMKDVNEALGALNKPEVYAAIKGEWDGLTSGVKAFLNEVSALKEIWGALSGGDVQGVLKGLRKADGASGPLARKLAPLPGDEALNLQDKIKDLEERRAHNDRVLPGRVPERQAELTREIEKLTAELKRLRENGGATKQDMSFGGSGFGLGGMIHKAGFGSGGFAGFGGFRFGHGSGFSEGAGAGASAGGVGRGRFGSLPPQGSGVGSGADAPRGDGRGTRGAARTGEMMRYAMDQLRREGVPKEHLRAGAAHLVGQAQMESQLNPNAKHDPDRNGNPTGYGIYGARLGRRTKMLDWLEKNGYARNSAEGQMRYMAREAMTDRTYAATRRILMGQGSGDVDADTNTITGNFEAPKVINRRSPAVRDALRIGPDKESSPSAFPPVRSRADLSKASGAADVMYPLGWGRREADGTSGGDSMMGRAFGPGGVSSVAPTLKADGKVSIHLAPGMENARARVTMDGMFNDVRVTRGTQVT